MITSQALQDGATSLVQKKLNGNTSIIDGIIH